MSEIEVGSRVMLDLVEYAQVLDGAEIQHDIDTADCIGTVVAVREDGYIKVEFDKQMNPVLTISPTYILNSYLPVIHPEPYVTKDSGQREEFSTGARRDTQDNKPRYDLISPFALRRLADLMSRGAKKYGEHNWTKGIPMSRSYASMYRHMMQWAEGDTEEDHLAAVLFNACAIIHYEEMIARGLLPEEINDMHTIRGMYNGRSESVGEASD